MTIVLNTLEAGCFNGQVENLLLDKDKTVKILNTADMRRHRALYMAYSPTLIACPQTDGKPEIRAVCYRLGMLQTA